MKKKVDKQEMSNINEQQKRQKTKEKKGQEITHRGSLT